MWKGLWMRKISVMFENGKVLPIWILTLAELWNYDKKVKICFELLSRAQTIARSFLWHKKKSIT